MDSSDPQLRQCRWMLFCHYIYGDIDNLVRQHQIRYILLVKVYKLVHLTLR